VPKSIDYFFSIGSPWSYLGLDTLEELAERHVVEIKPYLATVIEAASFRAIVRKPVALMARRISSVGPSFAASRFSLMTDQL
jgi:2-hydroxychromene-2-carboxylate isomerase